MKPTVCLIVVVVGCGAPHSGAKVHDLFVPHDMSRVLVFPDSAVARDLAMGQGPGDDGGASDVDLAVDDTDLAMAGGGGPCHPVINEIQTGGINGSDEFIEVYNPCPNAVNVNGFTLGYRAGTNTSPANGKDGSTVAPLAGQLPSGAYLVVCGLSFGGHCDTNYGAGKMKDGAGSVGLRDAQASLVDSVGYGGVVPQNAFIEANPAPAPPTGNSISRLPNGADTNDNSTDFQISNLSTPGAVNR